MPAYRLYSSVSACRCAYISERSKQPICVILSMVSNMFGTDYGAMMAAVVVTMLPLILLYIVAQEQVVSGLTAGAVKG